MFFPVSVNQHVLLCSERRSVVFVMSKCLLQYSSTLRKMDTGGEVCGCVELSGQRLLTVRSERG